MLLLLSLGYLRHYAVENVVAERVRRVVASKSWVDRYRSLHSVELKQNTRPGAPEPVSPLRFLPTQSALKTLMGDDPKVVIPPYMGKEVHYGGEPANELETEPETVSHDEAEKQIAHGDAIGEAKVGGENASPLTSLAGKRTDMDFEKAAAAEKEEVALPAASLAEKKADMEFEKAAMSEKEEIAPADSTEGETHPVKADESVKDVEPVLADGGHKLSLGTSKNRTQKAEMVEVPKYEGAAVSKKGAVPAQDTPTDVMTDDVAGEEAKEADTKSTNVQGGIGTSESTITLKHPYPMVSGFKFENSTPEIMSQWQDKPLKTVQSLRRIQEVYIDSYVQWHYTQMKAIKGRKISSRNVRILLYKGKEGVGDRMRGMVHALFCAMFSKRLLVIDWRIPFQLNNVVELGVGTNFTFDERYFGKTTEYAKAPFNKNPRPEDLKMLLTGQKWIAMTKETRPTTNFLFRDVPKKFPTLEPIRHLGYIAREPWPTELFPLAFKVLLRAGPALRRRVEFFQRSQGFDLSRPFIGIHVRLGHDTLETHMRRFKTNLTIAETAHCTAQTALEMAKARGIDPPRFFLATDSAALRLALRYSLKEGDKRAVLMYGNWPVKHVRHLWKNVGGDLDAFINTFVDLLVLTYADSLLHMRSGFAYLARWMGGIEPQYIFSNANCLS